MHLLRYSILALISIESLHPHVLRLLAKAEPSAGVELLSFKRDRCVAVFRLPEEKYLLVEHGFTRQECIVKASGLSRLLKTMIKREFPRSHKVRLVKKSSLDELNKGQQKS